MILHCIKTASGLKPAYDTDFDKFKKLKIGEVYKCDIKKERNYEFHKKFFSLIAMAYDNQERYNNIDHYRKYLIIKAGFYTAYEMDGWTHKEADSISFSSMDEIKFAEVYSRMLDTIIAELGSTKEGILEEVINYM